MLEEVGLGSAIEEIGEEGLIAMKMFSKALIPCKKLEKKYKGNRELGQFVDLIQNCITNYKENKNLIYTRFV